MSRIKAKFDELKSKNKKALITFLTAGDPNLDTTEKIIFEMEKKGADIIEIGIPYSDPIAEGPVIQAANSRALMNNIKIKDVFEMVEKARERVTVPLVYLMYYNCILQYGPKKFFQDCKKCGIDGVILPDLPFEEKDEIEDITVQYDVDLITMVTPVSKERIKMLAHNARGFLYCVSTLGVTGVRSEIKTNFEEFFSYINENSKIPTAIGFGISTPEQVKTLKGYSDGIIVGSAIVRKIEESKSNDEAVLNVGSYVQVLRDALDT